MLDVRRSPRTAGKARRQYILPRDCCAGPCRDQSRGCPERHGIDICGFLQRHHHLRERWCQRAIWANSQAKLHLNLLIGPGYGFLLKNLVSYLKGSGDLRTPHNIFYYALGYSGWLGVFFFFSLQVLPAAPWVWRAYKITGQSFGVAIWASTLFTAFFGNAFRDANGCNSVLL